MAHNTNDFRHHRRRFPDTVDLIHEISRITHEKVKQNCPEMQRSCRMIIRELARKDNVTQLDLVHATHLKAPTVSVSLQKMEKNGIVMRKQDCKDLRAVRVFLTDKGKAINTHIVSKIVQQHGETEKCLTAQERDALHLLLTKVRDSLINTDTTA